MSKFFLYLKNGVYMYKCIDKMGEPDQFVHVAKLSVKIKRRVSRTLVSIRVYW